jgi:membrane-associated protease RseP (regulator of RpoE activity)
MAVNLAQQISEKLHDLIEVNAVYSSKKEILLRGFPKYDLRAREHEIRSRLAEFGGNIDIISTAPCLLIRLRPAETKKAGFPWVNAILFFLTGLTTLMGGALFEGVDWLGKPSLFIDNPLVIFAAGFPFSLSLLTILGFHEFGHYFAARYHKANVSLPYFIPAPTIVGTFGAVIKSRSAFINKKQLLDIGAAGPLAGFVVAIIVLIIGIKSSPILSITDEANVIYFGESLLIKFITYLTIGEIAEGQSVMINSIYLAGWVGILVTMFNLLPMGQLDGGHITYALFGKYQKILALTVIAGLALLSFYWPIWILWIFIGMVFRLKHPPTLLDEIPLDNTRKVIGYICLAIFILCFMPIPISN